MLHGPEFSFGEVLGHGTVVVVAVSVVPAKLPKSNSDSTEVEEDNILCCFGTLTINGAGIASDKATPGP
jgi:hypothetical protein